MVCSPLMITGESPKVPTDNNPLKKFFASTFAGCTE